MNVSCPGVIGYLIAISSWPRRQIEAGISRHAQQCANGDSARLEFERTPDRFEIGFAGPGGTTYQVRSCAAARTRPAWRYSSARLWGNPPSELLLDQGGRSRFLAPANKWSSMGCTRLALRWSG
jgi:hypothetical protein